MGKSAPLSVNSPEKKHLEHGKHERYENFRLSFEFLKGKRIYRVYLKFISHFSFSSLPSQVRSRSVSSPFQVRSLEDSRMGGEWELQGICYGGICMLGVG